MKVSTMLITLLVPLQAATHYVDHSVGTSGDGSSWPTAFITIQEALAASSAADVILVAAGNYYPDEGGSFSDNDRTATFQLVEGVRLEGGYPNGGGARDLASHRTVLSGDIDQNDDEVPSGSNCYTVVSGTDLTSSTLVDGFFNYGWACRRSNY